MPSTALKRSDQHDLPTPMAGSFTDRRYCAGEVDEAVWRSRMKPKPADWSAFAKTLEPAPAAKPWPEYAVKELARQLATFPDTELYRLSDLEAQR